MNCQSRPNLHPRIGNGSVRFAMIFFPRTIHSKRMKTHVVMLVDISLQINLHYLSFLNIRCHHCHDRKHEYDKRQTWVTKYSNGIRVTCLPVGLSVCLSKIQEYFDAGLTYNILGKIDIMLQWNQSQGYNMTQFTEIQSVRYYI